MVSNVLSIAGTDPSGGAGIQADLKAFSACGVYGMAVITAVVAQNTQGVRNFDAMRPQLVADQIDAVFEDVDVHAVKIGMLATREIIDIVADRLVHHRAKNIVLDPVMVAKSGHNLLSPDAVDGIRTRLVPIATLVTPNLPEAAVLLERAEPDNVAEMETCANELVGLGTAWALIKGGHLRDKTAVDVLIGDGEVKHLESPRIATTSDHGTGCTLSAAIASFLPAYSVAEATERAKSYLTNALSAGSTLNVGRPGGRGPVHHFYHWW